MADRRPYAYAISWYLEITGKRCLHHADFQFTSPSAEIAANADAKALLKISNVNQVAGDKTAAVRTKASEKRAAARQEAATDKRNAEYAVAKEKCDLFADDAKAACVKDAKVRFGQS